MQYKNIDLDQQTSNKSSESSKKNKYASNKDFQSSVEVDLLRKMFQELLDTRRFEINDFLQKEDSQAIMELAQSASIFKNSGNVKALGICLNNIANIQYKNNQFKEASLNFRKAVKYAQLLIKEYEQPTDQVQQKYLTVSSTISETNYNSTRSN